VPQYINFLSDAGTDDPYALTPYVANPNALPGLTDELKLAVNVCGKDPVNATA
jgi:hypothetical protein